MIKSLAFFFTLFAATQAMALSYYAEPITGTATTTSTQVMAANSLRSYVLVQNTGAVAIYVKFSTTAIATTEGVMIAPGGSYEPIVAPANAMQIKAASTTSTYVVITGN